MIPWQTIHGWPLPIIVGPFSCWQRSPAQHKITVALVLMVDEVLEEVVILQFCWNNLFWCVCFVLVCFVSFCILFYEYISYCIIYYFYFLFFKRAQHSCIAIFLNVDNKFVLGRSVFFLVERWIIRNPIFARPRLVLFFWSCVGRLVKGGFSRG